VPAGAGAGAEAIAHGSLCPQRIPTTAPGFWDPYSAVVAAPAAAAAIFGARFCRAMANILPIHQGLALTLTMRWNGTGGPAGKGWIWGWLGMSGERGQKEGNDNLWQLES